jgi:hypothetical protein
VPEGRPGQARNGCTRAALGCRGVAAPLALAKALFLLVALAAPPPAPGEEITRRVGQVTFRVDTTHAFPGGVVTVRLASRGRLGAAFAVLGGWRVPFFLHRGAPRALVPVPVTTVPGPATVGVEIAARRGGQRIPIPIEIPPRPYPARTLVLGEEVRGLVDDPRAVRDGRRLLALVRTQSPAPPEALALPVAEVAGRGFGERRLYAEAPAVESRSDASWGEYHRGLDFEVPEGSEVRAPAAGQVVFAGSLTLSGTTLVLDHGQGVVSVLGGLSRLDVRTDDRVDGRARIGLSGRSPLAAAPLLEWRVYLHGVPVDPKVLQRILD